MSTSKCKAAVRIEATKGQPYPSIRTFEAPDVSPAGTGNPVPQRGWRSEAAFLAFAGLGSRGRGVVMVHRSAQPAR